MIIRSAHAESTSSAIAPERQPTAIHSGDRRVRMREDDGGARTGGSATTQLRRGSRRRTQRRIARARCRSLRSIASSVVEPHRLRRAPRAARARSRRSRRSRKTDRRPTPTAQRSAAKRGSGSAARRNAASRRESPASPGSARTHGGSSSGSGGQPASVRIQGYRAGRATSHRTARLPVSPSHPTRVLRRRRRRALSPPSRCDAVAASLQRRRTAAAATSAVDRRWIGGTQIAVVVGVRPAIDLLLGLVLADAVGFLQPARELVLLARDRRCRRRSGRPTAP